MTLPEAEAAFLVLGDWLLERGHPVRELQRPLHRVHLGRESGDPKAIELARSAEPHAQELFDSDTALVEAFREQLREYRQLDKVRPPMQGEIYPNLTSEFLLQVVFLGFDLLGEPDRRELRSLLTIPPTPERTLVAQAQDIQTGWVPWMFHVEPIRKFCEAARQEELAGTVVPGGSALDRKLRVARAALLLEHSCRVDATSWALTIVFTLGWDVALAGTPWERASTERPIEAEVTARRLMERTQATLAELIQRQCPTFARRVRQEWQPRASSRSRSRGP